MKEVKKLTALFLSAVICLTNFIFLPNFSHLIANGAEVSEIISAWNITEVNTGDTSIFASKGMGKVSSTANISGFSAGGIKSANWIQSDGSKYWQIEVNTLGYNGITLEAQTRSSSSGPRDFSVEYSTNGSDFVKISEYASTDSSKVKAIDFMNDGNLSNVLNLPAECDNNKRVYIRFTLNSNVSISGGDISKSGTNSLNNIVFKGISSVENDQCHPVVTSISNLSYVENGEKLALYSATENADIYYKIVKSFDNADSIQYKKYTEEFVPADSDSDFPVMVYAYAAADGMKNSDENFYVYYKNPVTAVVSEWSYTSEDEVTFQPVPATDGTGIFTTNTTFGGNYMSGASGLKTGSWNGGSGSSYLQFEINSKGYYYLSFSCKMRSTATGPYSFDALYSLDNMSSWTKIASFTVSGTDYSNINFVNSDGTSTTALELPDACNDKEKVYVRFLLNSNLTADGSEIQSRGYNYINNIVVTGFSNDNERICGQVISSIENDSVITEGESLTLLSSTKGADIYYKLIEDGQSENSVEYKKYTAPIILNSLPVTVFAYAKKDGYTDSAVSSFTFRKQGTVVIENSSSLALWNVDSEELVFNGCVPSTDGRGIIYSGNSSVLYGGSSGGFKRGSWNTGDYWLINTTTQGYTDVKLSALTKSTNTGPANFLVEYSFDNENYVKLAEYTVTSSYADIKFKLNDGTSSNTLVFPEECNNKENFYIRFTLKDKIAVSGNDISASGTNYLKDVKLVGIHNGAKLSCTPVFSTVADNSELSADTVIYLYTGTKGADIYYSLNGNEAIKYDPSKGINPDISSRVITLSAYASINDEKHTDSTKSVFKYFVSGKTLNIASWEITDVSMLSAECVGPTSGECADNAKITSSLPFSYASSGIKTANWAGGRDSAYIQISFSASNYENIKITQMQHRSSGTGPKDFNIYYSINNKDWTYLACIVSPESSSLKPVSFILPDGETVNSLTLSDECDGAETVYIKFVLASEASAKGESLSEGSYIFNNIIIDGCELTDIPRCPAVYCDHEEISYVSIGEKVELFCDEEDAVIYYSTDGIHYKVYDGTIIIDTLPMQIKAYAEHNEYRSSERKIFKFYKYYNTNSFDPIPEQSIPNGVVDIKRVYEFKENTLVTFIGQVAYKYSQNNNGVLDCIVLQDIIDGQTVGIQVSDDVNSENYFVGDIVILTGKTFISSGVTIVKDISSFEVFGSFDPFEPQEVTIKDINKLNNQYLSEYVVLKDVMLETKTETKIVLKDSDGNKISILFPASYPSDYKSNYIIDVYCCYSAINNVPQLRTATEEDYVWNGKTNGEATDPTDPPEQKDLIYGDVNCDGNVNMLDVTELQRIIADLSSFSDFGELSREQADVNHDGNISMIDVTTIQRYIALLVDSLDP